MRLGVIARSEDRGIGLQSWEICRGLDPAAVLIVEPHNPRAVGPWPTHHERFAQWSPTVVRWGDNERLHEATVRAFLADVDVVYTVETLYDWQLAEWCAETGTGLVCHLNPEMLRPDRLRVRPITWWLPTPWMAERYPGARVVPMPVPRGRWDVSCQPAGDPGPTRQRPASHMASDEPIVTSTHPQRDGQQQPPSVGAVRFLHVAGHEAIWDRNGTRALADAWGHLPPAVRSSFRIVGQDGHLPRFPGARVEPNGVADYWSLYDGADVLVMPRRFGGLCLPVIEACGAGLAPLMLDVSPNEMWPGPRLAPSGSRVERAVGGRIDVAGVDPVALAAEIERLASDRDEVAKHQGESVAWAQGHSWPALSGLWLEALEAACR